MGKSHLDPLVATQITPLPERQAAEHHAADADALKCGDLKAHELAHASDLTLTTFAQHKSQLFFVLPADLGGLERYAIENQPEMQALERVG